jgi:hypothetical protein
VLDHHTTYVHVLCKHDQCVCAWTEGLPHRDRQSHQWGIAVKKQTALPRDECNRQLILRCNWWSTVATSTQSLMSRHIPQKLLFMKSLTITNLTVSSGLLVSCDNHQSHHTAPCKHILVYSNSEWLHCRSSQQNYMWEWSNYTQSHEHWNVHLIQSPSTGKFPHRISQPACKPTAHTLLHTNPTGISIPSQHWRYENHKSKDPSKWTW